MTLQLSCVETEAQGFLLLNLKDDMEIVVTKRILYVNNDYISIIPNNIIILLDVETRKILEQ